MLVQKLLRAVGAEKQGLAALERLEAPKRVPKQTGTKTSSSFHSTRRPSHSHYACPSSDR